MSGIIKKLLQCTIQNENFFLSFVFFELSRIEVLLEHEIFGMILFTFSVIFQINIFPIKIVIHNYISRHKTNQYCVPNRRKEIKKDKF